MLGPIRDMDIYNNPPPPKHYTVGKAAETDLFVAPSDYWEEVLIADVDDILKTKKKRH